MDVTNDDDGGTPADAVTAAADAFPQEGLAGTVTRLQEENRDTRDRMLRVAADFENFRKRNERERLDYMRFLHERILRDFLPIADNLLRALESARKSGDAPSVLAGVELVVSEFVKVLKKYGVEPIEAAGKPFDPQFHEALQQIETEESEPGAIVTEVQRGYLLNGRVLRPSLVVVAAAPEVTSPGVRRQFD
ncbi:MAG: nucleotide exchange factor GrpE [Deltaproteobacteria bacterium]|nr:nucleotide exchange factor GrpE [Deltaproteobacteria bacterium]